MGQMRLPLYPSERSNAQAAHMLCCPGRPQGNYIFHALAVPEGWHRVTAVYEDAAFRMGAVISATTFAACLFVWHRNRRKGQVEGAGTEGVAISD